MKILKKVTPLLLDKSASSLSGTAAKVPSIEMALSLLQPGV